MSNDRVKHVVLLVHGIRTFGDWQDRLAARIKEVEPGTEVHIYKYGYFGSIAFLIPFLRRPIIKAFQDYLTARAPVWKNARVDIIAHSFGCFVTAWALHRIKPQDCPTINTVVLCGSVLKQLFPWDGLVGQEKPIGRIINECGIKDYWPLIAQLFVWGMGNSGRRGFAGITGVDVGIINRYHALTHSGFFEGSFMEKHWLPILTGNTYSFGDVLFPPRTLGWSGWLEYYGDPLKLAYVILPAFFIMNWYWSQQTRVAQAELKAVESDLQAEKDRIQAEKDRAVAEKATAEKQREKDRADLAEQQERVENSLRLIADSYKVLYQNPTQAILKAHKAHKANPNAATLSALQIGYKVAILHHDNRRESAKITGSGPCYLACRWKEGELYTEISKDGKYTIVVTERDKEGASSRGIVYLLNNETLHVIDISPCYADEFGRRVEDVGFDRETKALFVVRQFYLSVYDLNGRCTGGYNFSRHTKSPVHLAEGYFQNKLLLGAESKGGLWLVEVGENPEVQSHTYTIQPEFHRDPAIAVQFNRDATLAAVVFESGRSGIITQDNRGNPILKNLPTRRVLFAGFDPQHPHIAFTAGESGIVESWKISGADVHPLNSYEGVHQALDWLDFGDDGEEIVAIGSDHTIFLFDRRSRKSSGRIDFSQDIDWAGTRALPSPPAQNIQFDYHVTPKVVSKEEAITNVLDAKQINDELWTISGDYTYGQDLFRVKQTESQRLEHDVRGLNTIEQHGNLIRTGNGLLYLFDGDAPRPIADKDTVVHAIKQYKGVRWVGTNKGLFTLRKIRLENRYELHRVSTVQVKKFIEIGESLWLATMKGAYILDGDRVIRITDPFVEVMDIKLVGDETWILSKDGPGYRVKGFFAIPFPSPRSRVKAVSYIENKIWILTNIGVLVIDDGKLRRVIGVRGKPESIEEVGGRIFLRTQYSLASLGKEPIYEIDPKRLVAWKTKVTSFSRLMSIDHEIWVQYEDKTCNVGRLINDQIVPFDLSHASVREIIDVEGEPWIATDRGVFRLSNGQMVQVEGLDMPVSSVKVKGNTVWLMAEGGVIRLNKSGGYKHYRTDSYSARDIVELNEEVLVLTAKPEEPLKFGSCVTYMAPGGPIYRYPVSKSATGGAASEAGFPQS